MQIQGILEISEICHFSSEVLVHVSKASPVKYEVGRVYTKEKE